MIGRYDNLHAAQKELNKFPSESKLPIRAILEIKNGQVDNDPRFIAGRNQASGMSAGFSFHWSGWDKMDEMISAGTDYVVSSQNPKGDFMVVAGRKVIGRFTDLNSAKEALKTIPEDSDLSRMIIEVENDKVNTDPRIVGGQNQDKGLPAFNKKWKGWADIDAMLGIAPKHVDDQNNPTPSPSPSLPPQDVTGKYVELLTRRFSAFTLS